MVDDIKRCFGETHKTINYVKRNSSNLRIIIFFDIIWCRIRYRVNLREYKTFEFYLIPGFLRKTYISIRVYNDYKNYLYSPHMLHILNNKVLLFERLKKYLGREVLYLNDISFKDFETFALKNKNILARKTNKSFLSSNKEYYLKDFRSYAFMLEQLKKDNNLIIEPLFKQDPLLDKISNNLVTIIIITICNMNRIAVVSSCIKFKEADTIVNGYIDINTLSIKGHLRDNKNRIYNKDIDGYKIPSLQNAYKLVKKLASELDEIREIEWSVCLTEDGNAYLVDANVSEDLIFEQTPEYLRKRVGLKPLYKKLMYGMRKYRGKF